MPRPSLRNPSTHPDPWRNKPFPGYEQAAYTAKTPNDRLQVLDLYSYVLDGDTPAIEMLAVCRNQHDIPIEMCRNALGCMRGTMYLCLKPYEGPEQDSPERLLAVVASMWRNIWKWLYDVFLYERHSFMPPSALELIYGKDVAKGRTQMLHVFSVLANGLLTTGGDTNLSIVGDSPGFLPLISKWWYDIAKTHQTVPEDNYIIISELGRLCIVNPRPGWIDTFVRTMGSPADLAKCILTHLVLCVRIPDSLKRYFKSITSVFPARLTEEIHLHLLSQNAPLIVIDAIRYLTSLNMALPDGIDSLLVYLSNVLMRNDEQARPMLKGGIIPVLARVAGRPFASYERSPIPHFPAVMNAIGAHSIYLSNIRFIKQSLDTIQREGTEEYLNRPNLKHQWWVTKGGFLGLRHAKHISEVINRPCSGCGANGLLKTSKRCSRCRALYCSRACQAFDWNDGNHRIVCRTRDLISAPDYELLLFRVRTSVTLCKDKLGLFYQKFVLQTRRNDLPPLTVVVDYTTFPTRVSLYPTISERVHSQFGDMIPEPLMRSRRCILVFMKLKEKVCLPAHGIVQPLPSYYTFQEFLDMNPLKVDLKVAEKGIDTKIKELINADAQFFWDDKQAVWEYDVYM